MPNARALLNGWPLLGVLSLALVAMAAAIVLGHRLDIDGIRMTIRATARTSFVFFALAFSASALFALWPNAWTGWQRRNRRYLGLSFAVSHTVHAAAIVAFARLDPVQFHLQSNTGTIISGGIAYGFIAALALTSFDRTAGWLGPHRHQRQAHRREPILRGAGRRHAGRAGTAPGRLARFPPPQVCCACSVPGGVTGRVDPPPPHP